MTLTSRACFRPFCPCSLLTCLYSLLSMARCTRWWCPNVRSPSNDLLRLPDLEHPQEGVVCVNRRKYFVSWFLGFNLIKSLAYVSVSHGRYIAHIIWIHSLKLPSENTEKSSIRTETCTQHPRLSLQMTLMILPKHWAQADHWDIFVVVIDWLHSQPRLGPNGFHQETGPGLGTNI